MGRQGALSAPRVPRESRRSGYVGRSRCGAGPEAVVRVPVGLPPRRHPRLEFGEPVRTKTRPSVSPTTCSLKLLPKTNRSPSGVMSHPRRMTSSKGVTSNRLSDVDRPNVGFRLDLHGPELPAPDEKQFPPVRGRRVSPARRLSNRNVNRSPMVPAVMRQSLELPASNGSSATCSGPFSVQTA